MLFRFASSAPESDTAEPFRFADAWRAYIACRRGKRRSASAQRYAVGVFDRLTDTVDALAQGLWKPSTAQAFVVTRPKAREVLAAAFDDRVVHHLLTPRLERQFEPVFIFDAWSNRAGKGIHGAVARLRGFMQSLSDNGAGGVGAGLPAKGVLAAPIRGQARSYGAEPHFLQLDIANFFNRIDRARLFELLRLRLERDALRAPGEPRHLRPALASRLLWLCRRLLTGNAAAGARPLGAARDFARLPPHKRLINAPPGKGLPIGNLTSQFFANVYLNELDQFVKHRLKCPHYLRYVDDFVLLAPDRPTLERWRDALRDFLRERLELELRDEGLIAPLAGGVDFLGYRVRGSHLICRPRVVGHCRESLARWRRAWVSETRTTTVIDLAPPAREALAATVASYAAHFRHAAHHRLWARLHRRFPLLPLLFHPLRDGVCRPAWAPLLDEGRGDVGAALAAKDRGKAADGPLSRASPLLQKRLNPVGAIRTTGFAAQWRYFHDRCAHWFPLPEGWQADNFRPWLLLLQVGRDVGVFADDARRFAGAWPQHGGRRIGRRGLGEGLAWPLRSLPSLFGMAARLGWHVAWVAEDGVRRRGGKRRVLRRLAIAHTSPLPRRQAPVGAALAAMGGGEVGGDLSRANPLPQRGNGSVGAASAAKQRIGGNKRSSRASPLLQPDGVPMRVIAQRPGEAGAQWIRDDVAGDPLHILLPAQRMVVEAFLPQGGSGSTAGQIDGAAAGGLEAPRRCRQRIAAQREQPVQVIRHQDEGEVFRQVQVVACAQDADGQASEVEIGEDGTALMCDRGEQINPARLRNSPATEIRGMGLRHDGKFNGSRRGGLSRASPLPQGGRNGSVGAALAAIRRRGAPTALNGCI